MPVWQKKGLYEPPVEASNLRKDEKMARYGKFKTPIRSSRYKATGSRKRKVMFLRIKPSKMRNKGR